MSGRPVNLALVVPLVLALGLVAAFGFGLLRKNPQELPTVFIDKPVPRLPDEALEGYPGFDAAMLQGEGWKLVNFWASWCPPCRAEHPQFMKLAEEGWVIFGINKEDRVPNAQGFLRELGDPYAGIGVDPQGRIGVDWGVYGLPETFLVDGQGRIRHRFPGAVTSRVWNDRFIPIMRSLEAQTQ